MPAGAFVPVRGQYPIYPEPSKDPSFIFGDPATFAAAAKTQAGDYDKIMAMYDELAKSYAEKPITAGQATASQVGGIAPVKAPQLTGYTSITPQLARYEQSGDVSRALGELSGLASTGGYSEQGIRDIRERGISPIRSIYANARENINRQRALQGGYSPSYNATTAELARQEASQIGDITTNVNAQIAQNVAANRIAAAPSYASAASTANAAKTAVDQRNAEIVNQINQLNAANALRVGEFNVGNEFAANQFNASTAAAIAEANANRATQTSQFNTQLGLNAALAGRQGQLAAIEGKRGLYGTTPGLVGTFGNQVVQAGQLAQGQQQLRNQLVNSAMRTA